MLAEYGGVSTKLYRAQLSLLWFIKRVLTVSEYREIVNLHIEDLQKRELTQLPEDRETLIQFYDRLQQRKARRKQWLFYAEASTEQLADLVLKYLDEEIEDRKAGGYQ